MFTQMEEEKTIEQLNVELMEAAAQSGNIRISKLTASMFKTALQMDAAIGELITLFDCVYNAEQSNELDKRLNELYIPLRDAIFQEIGLYIGDNAFQTPRDFGGL